MIALRALRRALDAWNKLWFAPADARDLGAMRWALGIVLIVSHLMLWPDLDLLYNDAGPFSTETIHKVAPKPRISHLDGISDPTTLSLIHAGTLLILVGFTVGWNSRLMAILAFLIQAGLHHRNPLAQHGGDRVLRLAAFYMCFAPVGAAWSVDAWLARRKRERRGDADARMALAPVTAHRLVQLQWIIIYLFTAIDKLPGGTWKRGEALYYALSDRTFQRFPIPMEAILQQRWIQPLLKISTWGTLGWELAFGAMVLWRPTRKLALWLGLLIHIGIAGTMMVGSFSFAMLWGYLAFLDAGWAGRLEARWRAWRRRSEPARGGGSKGVGDDLEQDQHDQGREVQPAEGARL